MKKNVNQKIKLVKKRFSLNLQDIFNSVDKTDQNKRTLSNEKSSFSWQSPESLIASNLKKDFRRWKIIETNSNFWAVKLWVKAFFFPLNKPMAQHPQHAKFIGSACPPSKWHSPGFPVVRHTENGAQDHRHGNIFDTHHPAPTASTNHIAVFNITPLGVLQSNQRVPNKVSIARNELINFRQQLIDAKKLRSFIRYRSNAYPLLRGCAQSAWSNWWIAESCPKGVTHWPKSKGPLNILIVWCTRHVIKQQLLWWIGEKLMRIFIFSSFNYHFWSKIDEMNLEPNLQSLSWANILWTAVFTRDSTTSKLFKYQLTCLSLIHIWRCRRWP